MKKDYRIIISGGGTGGHIFPALSIADAIKSKHPEAKILFVGADNRMEMQRVPDAGYDIIGLPIAGFDRKNLLKNFKVLWLILKSQLKARKVIKDFAPQVAVGVGGYASGPTLKMAASMNIPTLIQEQNSYAGVTNKILSKKANMISSVSTTPTGIWWDIPGIIRLFRFPWAHWISVWAESKQPLPRPAACW